MRAVQSSEVVEAFPFIQFSLEIHVVFVAEELIEFLLIGSVLFLLFRMLQWPDRLHVAQYPYRKYPRGAGPDHTPACSAYPCGLLAIGAGWQTHPVGPDPAKVRPDPRHPLSVRATVESAMGQRSYALLRKTVDDVRLLHCRSR